MGGPGSGRRRVVVANGTNGMNGHTPAIPSGPRVTFADVISKMQAAPPVASGSLDSPKVLDVSAPAAPPTPEGNRSFASMAGYIAVNVGVSVIGDHIRRRGYEPREVSGEDLDRTTEATADAFARALGDLEVPWWAGLAAAWGNLYLAMRVGATKLPPKLPAGADTTTTPSSPAPPSPLGQVLPPRPPRAPLRPGGPLPAIESSS